MAIYRGHHVATSEGPEPGVVHLVERGAASDDTAFGVVMTCGIRTTGKKAVENIKGGPITCLWCAAGKVRFG
jgi:hypothetical protein